MKKWLLLALVSSPLWLLLLGGLIFDTVDFLLGMAIAVVIGLSVWATVGMMLRD